MPTMMKSATPIARPNQIQIKILKSWGNTKKIFIYVVRLMVFCNR